MQRIVNAIGRLWNSGCLGKIIVGFGALIILSYGAWSYNVRAYPGYTGYSAPYGSCSARPGGLYSVYGWTVSKNPEYDYGVVKLDCNIGNSTGWLGFRWQSASLDGLSVHIQGYPADKGWGQWGHNGSVYRTYPQYLLKLHQRFRRGADR